ncbi:Peroxiredoxin [Pedobacter terrae]|uniref:Peroxiredoxin n=1 Tax=Pedobacter terrae TaxID=405671 RepID=A0A1G8BSU3_9SPHI|nr:redoxin domain-containing protein [Pedobacter terrae]SDH36169.1 Peroxiredoxin [Pedobacter terrae]
MKKIILAILMLSSLSMMAQQREEAAVDSKLKALRSEKNVKVRQQKIKALENGTDKDLMLLIQYYDKNAAKKEALTKTLQKKYPQSENARMMRIASFLKLKGIPEMELHLQSLIKEYPNLNLDMEKSLLSSTYAEVPDAKKVLQHINSMKDPVFKVRALVMAIELMAAVNNTKALELATGELEEAKKMKGKTALSEPLKIDPKAAYEDYINLYGKLLFNAGKNDEAYQYTTEAYNSIKNKDGELIENYAFLSSLNGKYEEALPILAKSVREGKFDQRYIEQVRKGYSALYPGKDIEAYITALKNVFIDKIKMQVSKLMISKAAPNFTVTDVNGKVVSLADFKGKTIVLDFWATWCGPCVASFPAMQMAVNRYANDPNVKFLFIHTWDNDPNPLADAKNFLNKRNYKFDLYMDPRDPVTKHSAAADAFKIDGIPAKFIIDGNGKVRFEVSGFEGKNEAAAEEIVQMVEMARKS